MAFLTVSSFEYTVNMFFQVAMMRITVSHNHVDAMVSASPHKMAMFVIVIGDTLESIVKKTMVSFWIAHLPLKCYFFSQVMFFFLYSLYIHEHTVLAHSPFQMQT